MIHFRSEVKLHVFDMFAYGKCLFPCTAWRLSNDEMGGFAPARNLGRTDFLFAYANEVFALARKPCNVQITRIERMITDFFQPAQGPPGLRRDHCGLQPLLDSQMNIQ